MALSQTSIELDILTVGTMFNKNSGLSTLDSYVPAVSSYGNVFYKWTNQPITSLYQGLFYGYKNDSLFYSSLSTISGSNINVSTSMYDLIPILSTFSKTNLSTLQILSSIDISTIYSFGLTVSSQSTAIQTVYSTTTSRFSSFTPGVSTTISSFYNTLFSPFASTLLTIGNTLYVPSISNPSPIRYIGPGISSIVSNFSGNPFSTNITITFPDILQAISSGVFSSNLTIDPSRNSQTIIINTATSYIDGGSSISTLYTIDTNTFLSTLTYASSFLQNVSDVFFDSSTILGNISAPTLRGSEIGAYISSASTSLTLRTSTLASLLASSMVSSVLRTPLSNFSTSILSSLTSTYLMFVKTDITPGLLFLQSSFSAVINPFYLNLDVSTNRFGYQTVSTNTSGLFSTFSTSFASILGTNSLSSLSQLNMLISSLSTQITTDTYSITSTVQSNITGPGISSIFQSYSTNLSVSFNDYSANISTIFFPFSNAFRNVNSIPGICTLNSTVTNWNSTLIGNIIQFPSRFSSYTGQIQTNTIGLSSLATFTSSYTQQYISTGNLAYAASYSTFTNYSTTIIANSNYLSTMFDASGTIQDSLDSLYTLEANVLDIIKPFLGSTIYYPMLTVISNYSTSVDAIPPNGSAHTPYLLRSTTFYTITTGQQSSYMSSVTLSNLSIRTLSSLYPLDVQGSAKILLDSSNDGGIPSMLFPNFHLFTSDTLVSSLSTTALSSRFSTLIFNDNSLLIQRYFYSSRYGGVGINTSNPSYSLDIGIGDARKPSGSMWITGSDRRIKTNIQTADIPSLLEKMSNLTLVEFTWSSSFSKTHGLSALPTLGFLSQSVQNTFPESICQSEENGFSDFLSLDTDQLLKAKFAATQHLLERVSTLQMRINSLLKES